MLSPTFRIIGTILDFQTLQTNFWMVLLLLLNFLQTLHLFITHTRADYSYHPVLGTPLSASQGSNGTQKFQAHKVGGCQRITGREKSQENHHERK